LQPEDNTAAAALPLAEGGQEDVGPPVSGHSPGLKRHRSEKHAQAAPRIDKSVLAFPEPRRVRDRQHLKFVATQPCLICGRTPSDAHHIRFAQLRALGRKVSDEFTVPLCRTHHRQLHGKGNEVAWWKSNHVEPLRHAHTLWSFSRRTGSLSGPASSTQA
jgi:hypothetical protein